jgi:membrane protease YdiL (CAAX protease family)
MHLVSYFLSLLLAAYTILIEPIVRTNFYRNLKKQLKTDPGARVLFYRTQVLWEWSWVVVLVLIFYPKPNQLPLMGLQLPNTIGWILTAALVIGFVLSTYLLRRSPTALANMQRSLEASSILLPDTPRERKWYLAAAITAGICEELLYRGFFIYFIRTNFPMLNDILILSLISGVVYGLSRAYQGTRGILQTGLMGFSFAIVRFLSKSLFPAMLFHILAELRNLYFWPGEEGKKKAK